MIFVREDLLRCAIVANVEHYHVERNHQGLDNQLIEPGEEVGTVTEKIEHWKRLGRVPS